MKTKKPRTRTTGAGRRYSIRLGKLEPMLDSVCQRTGVLKDDVIRVAIGVFLDRYNEPESALKAALLSFGDI